MKYIETAKVIFKAQFAYRFDLMLNMLLTITRILMAYVLWSAIFKGKTEVSGFTFQAMLTYYILSAFISQLDQSIEMGWEIGRRILDGTFSARMVQPVNIFGFHAAQSAGMSVFLLGFNLLTAAAWALLLRIPVELTANVSVILGTVLLILLGLLFMMQLNFLIGIMAFKFHEIWMFMMIKDNLVYFATGGMIPLTLLPAGLLAAMRFLPFYYVTYLPSVLLMGRNASELLTGLAVLAGWNLAFAGINRFAYRRLRTLYDGVGI